MNEYLCSRTNFPKLMEEKKELRINKFFTEAGYCSRRQADQYVEQGRVTINGVKAVMGSKISDSDEVRLDGKLIAAKNDDFIYIVFNKPRGIVCTTDTKREKKNIIDYIKFPERIFPIGRLDKDSQGLIFLTNDGDIVNQILRSKNGNEKEYLVKVKEPIGPDFIRKMGNGVPILGTITKKCFVEQIDEYRFRIVLTQGLNRQIRRMTEYFGNEVVKLQRVRIMNVKIDIPIGKWRFLTNSEITEIKSRLTDASKTN